MNNRVIDVYKHYKSLYGSMLLLFRVQNNYEAYFDDAKSISTILNLALHTEPGLNELPITKVCLPDSTILDLVAELSEYGKECKLIQQRNTKGDFAIPDINILINEQKLDY